MSEFGMRDSIVWMKKYFKDKPVVGAELGVWKGNNAERLLSMLNIEILHLIDLWITPNYAKDRYDYSKHYNEVINKFLDNPKVIISKIDTVQASKNIRDNSLDFVYIDADHTYEGCKRDIEAWWSKIKKGGTLVGHDYYCCDGVHKAVDEFILHEKINLISFEALGLYDKRRYGEWLVIK